MTARHPTPADILASIHDALQADDTKAIKTGDKLVPVRTWGIIRRAVTAACDKHEGVSQ